MPVQQIENRERRRAMASCPRANSTRQEDKAARTLSDRVQFLNAATCPFASRDRSLRRPLAASQYRTEVCGRRLIPNVTRVGLAAANRAPPILPLRQKLIVAQVDVGSP